MHSNPNGPEPPAKRPKLELTPKHAKFSNAEEIRTILHDQNLDTITKGLTALQIQLTVWPNEPPIAPQDERLLLAQHWMEKSFGAQDLFRIWETTNSRQTPVLTVIVSLISSLLTLFSSHYSYHTHGSSIVKTLLASSWLRKLNSYIGGAHKELTLMTLKLFNAMSNFAGGKEKKAVLEGFAWETKSLPKLLSMRRKIKDDIDPLFKPDIRTLYILFILSFIEPSSSSQTKTLFFEHHRDVFLSIFKGLIQDHYSVIRKVLETCWAGFLSDPKLKRTLKISVFGETTIGHLLKLYDRSQPEDGAPDHIPADLVHHFLLAICTRIGTGICFKDRGWYPRQTELDVNEIAGEARKEEDEEGKKSGGKIYNKILANIIKVLKINEDARQQELALKIIQACPELVAGYWSGAALTLEPRLSSKWIANIAFFGTIISLPIPAWSFLVPSTSIYNPAPPPLSAILSNIIPSVNTKAHFSKGLQSSSGLVQHCTALALAKCLNKLSSVIQLFKNIAGTLEETEEEGQWFKRLRDLEQEARRRVPEFQVVVAFSQQKIGDLSRKQGPNGNTTKVALLAESAHRLLWLYHSCLPAMVAEARFDVGRLLLGFNEKKLTNEDSDIGHLNEGEEDLNGYDEKGTANLLKHLAHVHVLRLLKESDQFIWTGKAAPSSPTYLYILLKEFITTQTPATRTALSSLLQHSFSASTLFQGDLEEPQIWLSSLPRIRRSASAESPDGVSLTDEGEAVVVFLDECIQRCLKTLYRYIEDMHTFAEHATIVHEQNGQLDTFPSPLLMTVIEQLGAKVTKGALTPSDILALSSFIRKLVFRMMGRLPNLVFLQAIVNKVDAILLEEHLFPLYPVLTSAVRKEVSMMHNSLLLLHPIKENLEVAPEIQGFFDQIEQIPIPRTKKARITAAYELIDWLRLVKQPLGIRGIERLVTIISQFYKPAVQDIVENLDPACDLLWDGMNIRSQHHKLQNFLSFEWLFLHATEEVLIDNNCRHILANFACSATTGIDGMKRNIRFIAHGLAVVQCPQHVIQALFFILGDAMKNAAAKFSAQDYDLLRDIIFVHAGIVKQALMSEYRSNTIAVGVEYLVNSCLNPLKDGDRKLAFDISNYWLNVFRAKLSAENFLNITTGAVWIKYLPSKNLLDLLYELHQKFHAAKNEDILDLLHVVLVAIKERTFSETGQGLPLSQTLPLLLALRPILAKSADVEDLIALAVEASLPVCFNGQSLCSRISGIPNISSLVHRAETQFPLHSQPSLIGFDLEQFLNLDSWTESTVKIVCGLLYQNIISKNVLFSWLGSESCARGDIGDIVPVLHDILDFSRCTETPLPDDSTDIWMSLLSRILKVLSDESRPTELRVVSGSCISLLLDFHPSGLSQLLIHISNEMISFPAQPLTPELLAVVYHLQQNFKSESKTLALQMVDRGIQWAIQYLSDANPKATTNGILGELVRLIELVSECKAHLVETVLGVVIQHHLADPLALKLATVALSATSLKPLVVNRLLQAIVQHSYFRKFCALGYEVPAREAIVDLLHAVFNVHPNNTCQVTHIQPLITIYKGSLSSADLKILSIFRLFEKQRATSVAELLSRWSSTSGSLSSTALEALQSLDPIQVLRTCINFPRGRHFVGELIPQASRENDQLYDPVFIMLLFNQMLVDSPPSSAFSWVELFRTNVVGLFIRALSSKDSQMREMALCQITALWKHLEFADLQEKPHVLYILTLLKNVFPPDLNRPPQRLPSYTTLLLHHSLKGIFYPSNFIYPLTARFLLQRPELDITDVPMLYTMLYSDSDNWKKERGWIIRYLSDGMISTEDWRVLKRRHTWDLLASLFQSSEGDHALRNGVLEVLANLTCNVQAVTSLTLKSGLLSWINIQLTLTRANRIEWLKILENVLYTANAEKLETSTDGEWRQVIARCLLLVLREYSSSIFPNVVLVLLRLSVLPGRLLSALPSLLDLSMSCLRSLETSIILPGAVDENVPKKQNIPTPPHRAYNLHESWYAEDPLQVWGSCVEMLWQVAMTSEDKPSTWDALTSRLLVWRAIDSSSRIGEWARVEVVRNMARTSV